MLKEEEIISPCKRNMLADPDQGNDYDESSIRDGLKEIYRRRVSTYAARGRSAPCFETMSRPSPSFPSLETTPQETTTIRQRRKTQETFNDDFIRDRLKDSGGGSGVFRGFLPLLLKDEGPSQIQTRFRLPITSRHHHHPGGGGGGGGGGGVVDEDKDVIPVLQRRDPGEEGNYDESSIRDGLKEIYRRRVSTYAARGRSAPCFETVSRPSPSFPSVETTPQETTTIRQRRKTQETFNDDFIRDRLKDSGGGSGVFRGFLPLLLKDEGPSRIQTRFRLPITSRHHHHPGGGGGGGGGGGVVDEDKDGIPVLQRDLVRSLNLSSSDSSPPPPPFRFPWDATDTGTVTDGYAIKILSMGEIVSKLGITDIRGELVCSKCHHTFTIDLDLRSNSEEIAAYFGLHRDYLVDCMPDSWHHPYLPPCPNRCGFNLEPVIPAENSDYQRINWLFLFLGKLLGCCSVEQLDFFCKHSRSDYQTGAAKGRLLYLTYITLIKQLYPLFPVS